MERTLQDNCPALLPETLTGWLNKKSTAHLHNVHGPQIDHEGTITKLFYIISLQTKYGWLPQHGTSDANSIIPIHPGSLARMQ